ncbi:FAD-dependent oxidoreductase [Vibrio sp. M60_M31a]
MLDPPHSHASHHGETRIIRHAYGEGEEYVPLALRAQGIVGRVRTVIRQSLFLKTGVLNIGDEHSPFISMLIASAKKHQLPLEILSADEANQRFEGLNLPPEYIGCFESTSGVLRVEDCIQAYRDLALAHGATLLHTTRYLALNALKMVSALQQTAIHFRVRNWSSPLVHGQTTCWIC